MADFKIDAVLNRIVIDSCFLIGINLLGLILFGTIQENGDTNAGSMYSLFIIPLIPLIIVSLGMVELGKKYFNFLNWVSSLMPLFLMIFGFWLDQDLLTIFIAAICLVVLYSLVKTSISIRI